MIGTVGELDEALGLLERAYRELEEEGQEAARPRVRVMVEVSASVHLADILIQRVNFLSIGTNDLTPYMLAVDRNNAQVVTPYDGLHPAVLNAIRHVIEAAHRRGKPVSVCGEMAGHPAGALLLLGMGVDTLSMSPALLAQVKLAIRCFTHRRARLLADTALGMEDGFSNHRLMTGALQEIRGGPQTARTQLDLESVPGLSLPGENPPASACPYPRPPTCAETGAYISTGRVSCVVLRRVVNLSLKQVSAPAGVSPSGVSRILSDIEAQRRDVALASLLERHKVKR